MYALAVQISVVPGIPLKLYVAVVPEKDSMIPVAPHDNSIIIVLFVIGSENRTSTEILNSLMPGPYA